MNKVQKIMLGAAAVSMIASCSSEFDGPQSATDTQSSAVKVTAGIGALSSRVSNLTSWEANDVIGLSTSIDANIPYITKDGSGKFEPNGNDILYIKGSEAVTVSGYYPYSENVTDGVISFDVSKDGNYDYLFDTKSATREKPDVNLNFSHVMSYLVFNFSEKIDRYTLSGLVTTGTFDIKSGVITPGTTVGDISGTQTQAIAAFLPPQSMKGVKLSFVKGGVSYSATLDNYEIAKGNQYTYSVEFDGTDVAVKLPEASTISGYTENDKGKLTYTEQEPEMAVGDWYLSDGTTVSHTKTLTEEQKGKVIGVVVYAGDPSTTALATYFNSLEGCSIKGKCDPADVTVDYMADKYPGCTKGIVMAIGGRDEKKQFFAENITTSVTEWWNSQDELKAVTMALCADDITIGSDNIKSKRYYCLGVQNTYILEKYVGDENSVAAIDNLENFRKANPTPEGTTGWYIPSTTEITQFLFGSTSEGVKTVIKSSLEAVNATPIYYDQYWSSSEGFKKDSDHQWFYGKIGSKTADEVTTYSISVNRVVATSTSYNIYFLAF